MVLGKFFPNIRNSYLILIGRFLSLIYFVFLIALIYFIGKTLNNRKAGLLGALFLVLSPILITQSHFSMPDLSNVFWIYMTSFTALLYFKKKKILFFFIACISAGFAIGTKYGVVSIIPILYILYLKLKESKKFVPYILLSILIIFLSFQTINAFYYDYSDLEAFESEMLNKNINSNNSPRVLNFFIIPFEVLVGVGLPIFFLFSFWIYKNFSLKKSNTAFFVLPALTQFLLLISFESPLPRFILPIIPAIAIVSGLALSKLEFNNLKLFLILSLIIIYQLVAIVPNQYYYVEDTRLMAREYVKNNLNPRKFYGVENYAGGGRFQENTISQRIIGEKILIISLFMKQNILELKDPNLLLWVFQNVVMLGSYLGESVNF